MGDARRAALTVLEKCRRSGAWSDAVLGSVVSAAGLDARDRSLAAALCYGVEQNRMLLDATIEAFSSIPLRKVEPKVLDILRISAYQLLFLEKIPASAAVNEGVRLCRDTGFQRASGYVNALLRKIAAHPAPPKLSGPEAQQLSIKYSHPLWLTEYLLSRLGDEAEAFLRADNAPAPANLQVNTLKTDITSLRDSLASEGVESAPHPWLPDCLVAETSGDLSRTKAFRDGWFYVQDAAAKLSVLIAKPQPGQRILDLCAAPGGKSFAAAILSGGRAKLVSCDLHEKKLKRLRDGAERLGLSIETLPGDAGENNSAWNGNFDLVIADVPCSGLGVIRKKPDIRYKDPAAFDGLQQVQKRILENARRYVHPGGTLLYSTCTVRSEENENVVRDFLEQHSEFSPEGFEVPWGESIREGMLQLWPQRNHTDGFFIAKLRRSL